MSEFVSRPEVPADLSRVPDSDLLAMRTGLATAAGAIERQLSLRDDEPGRDAWLWRKRAKAALSYVREDLLRIRGEYLIRRARDRQSREERAKAGVPLIRELRRVASKVLDLLGEYEFDPNEDSQLLGATARLRQLCDRMIDLEATKASETAPEKPESRNIGSPLERGGRSDDQCRDSCGHSRR